MDNLPTTPTSILNNNTVAATVLNNATTPTSVGNQTNVSPTVIDNEELTTARVEGLWVDRVSPWQLSDIWQFQAVNRSNVLVTNL